MRIGNIGICYLHLEYDGNRKGVGHMWFDGVIVVILIFTIVQGFRRGFIHTFVHTAGWLLAVVLGFVWYPRILDYLKNQTGIYNSIHDKITARITENADSVSNTTLSNIPEVISEMLL
jgi:uncharacterized membrane protein required for colicin V production